MKYCKTYEAFKKGYQQKIDLDDFKAIKKGTKLLYMGSEAEVLDNNGFTLTLKQNGKTFTVNKSMFDRGGMLKESKMPDKYIGNDEIVYLKTKEDSRGANYNLYYKGHDIDAGGRRFGSEKELKDFAANYILSNQWYNKLRYADPKPLPESLNEGADNLVSDPELEEAWYQVYNERFKNAHPGIFKIMLKRPPMDKRELNRIWEETYDKSFEDEHPNVWAILFDKG